MFLVSRIAKLHHLNPNFSGGGPPDPHPPQHILQSQKLSCQMCVCVERGLVLIELIHALLCVFKEDLVSDMESDLFCLLLLVSLT